MLPTGFRKQLHEELLRFLWRQWSQLGVAGDAPFRDRWIMDPEALLLATLDLGRFDPRLFDETLDWCVRNAAWLSVQRIKNLVRVKTLPQPDWAADAGETQGRTLAAFGAVMEEHDPTARWRTLTRAFRDTPDGPQPFFLDRGGDALPLFGKMDVRFERAGLVRSPVEVRGLSGPVPMDAPACLLLKLRSLFGLAPRAETVAYLLTHPAAGAREIARAASYSPTAVHYALAELAAGQFVHRSPRGSYEMDGGRWRAFLGSTSPPVWVDWRRVFAALALLTRAFARLETETLSPYLRASRMLGLYDALSETLFDSGLPNVFAAPCRLEDVGDALPDRTRQFIAYLNAVSPVEGM